MRQLVLFGFGIPLAESSLITALPGEGRVRNRRKKGPPPEILIDKRSSALYFVIRCFVSRGIRHMELDRELLKGSINLLIFRLLSQRDMYGYEIIQEASRRSENAFQFKEGTLYPALHQLQRQG